MEKRNENRKNIKDVIRQMRFYPEKRKDVFLSMPYEVRATILTRLSPYTRNEVLKSFPNNEIVEILEQLDPDDASDIIYSLPKSRQQKIINGLSEELKRGVEMLTQFDQATSSGLMNIDYIQAESNDKIRDVAKKLKEHEKRTGRTPVVIALSNGKLVGYVPAFQLGFGSASERIKKYIHRIPVVDRGFTQEQVIEIFKAHPHDKIAVMGTHGNVVGIIYSDDVLRLMDKRQSASLYDFAGVSDEETVLDRAKLKVQHRYKWLIVNMATAFLAAFTVSMFDETIAKYVLLAVYMPIVAGMGGNAATQTLAVLVRGIALKQIDLKNSLPILKRELMAGLMNGLINGAIVAAVVMLFNRDVVLAAVLGVAMIANLLVAAFFGTLVPLIMQKLGKDPATSATIFITTATDVLGFLVFLGLATLILE
ncbi:MAG: magnesium transporter [bacterium]|nr:magnesium transporter [bacterium]